MKWLDDSDNCVAIALIVVILLVWIAVGFSYYLVFYNPLL